MGRYDQYIPHAFIAYELKTHFVIMYQQAFCYTFLIILPIYLQVVSDGEVTWYESLIMLVLYIGYIIVMRYLDIS